MRVRLDDLAVEVAPRDERLAGCGGRLPLPKVAPLLREPLLQAPLLQLALAPVLR